MPVTALTTSMHCLILFLYCWLSDVHTIQPPFYRWGNFESLIYLPNLTLGGRIRYQVASSGLTSKSVFFPRGFSCSSSSSTFLLHDPHGSPELSPHWELCHRVGWHGLSHISKNLMLMLTASIGTEFSRLIDTHNYNHRHKVFQTRFHYATYVTLCSCVCSRVKFWAVRFIVCVAS